jgi:hypothetical protein
MRHRGFAISFLLLLGLVGLLSSQALAQTVNGSFSGTVLDQSQAAVPGASVTITNAATGVSRETTANASGEYTLPNIPPGVYNFTVRFKGFATLENQGVTLRVNQNATLDFTLKPGSVQEQVTVEAQAPLANLVNATVSTVIGSEKVEQLPLNGRQFTQLILLTPGAAPQSSGQQGFFEIHTDYGAVSPAVNGSRPEMNNFTIDGVENNELFFNFPAINPPPDAIQEFNVQSAMSSGQYGRAAGANVNVVTRSGSNEIHGDAWEFLRNTSLDARNFFNPDVSIFHQNQFGGTIGAPLKRNKVWAFGWYEGFRKTLGSTILSLIPTPAELGGNLSAFPPIYNPFTTRQVGTDAQGNPIFARDPFPNNQIPTALLNPTALAVAKYAYPAPNYSGSGVNFLNSEPVSTDTNQFGVRVDAALSTKTNLFGRFAWDKATRVLPNDLPGQPTNQFQLGVQPVIGLTHTFSPTALLDIHAQYLRTSIQLLGIFPPEDFLQSNGLLQDWPPQTGLRPVLPGFSISDVAGVPGTAQSLPGGPINNWQFSAAFTKILGKHTLTMGGSVVHTWVLDNCTYASGSFDNLPTSDPQNSSTTGSGLASFLLGVPSAATRLVGSAEQQLFGNYYGLYFDDVWKATPKLTVTLGVRYDYASPLQEEQGRQGSLNFYTSTPAQTVWMIDQSAQPQIDLSASSAKIERVSNGIFLPDRKDWAPRVAVAYQLGHDLVVRSGYGIFYDFNQSNVQNTQDIMGQWPFGFPDFTPPNLNQPSVANPRPQNILGVNVFPPFVPSADPPANPGFAANQYNRRPYVQVWNLGVDKSLGNDWLLSVTYLGSKGTRIPLAPTLNIAPTPGPGNPQLRAALPQFAPYEVTAAWGNSSYEAGQVKVEKRFSKGLSFLASYTFGKSIDYQSATHGSAQPGEGIQNGLDFKADRAVSDFDVPQNFVFSFVYNLPFGAGQRFGGGAGKVPRYLMTGWQVNGIIGAHSGFPVNIYIPFDNANTGSGTVGSLERPSVSGPLLPSGFHRSLQEWFDTTAVFLAPFGTAYGNLGRNPIRQDRFSNVDFGLTKNSKLTERTSLEFRSEFFNLFNHPNFGPPDGNFSDLTFGQVLSAGNPRFIQFGLKFLF